VIPMSKFKTIILGNLPSLTVIAGLLILRGFGFMQSLELMAFDQMLRSRPQESTDDRIVIIGIQEGDLHRLQSYPVADRILAQTIQSIAVLQPAAIGIDIFRDFAVPPGQKELQQVIQSTPNLFMAYRHTADDAGVSVAAPAIATPDQQGFVDVPLDRDGNLRRMLLGFQDNHEASHIALSVQLATTFLARNQQELQVTDTGLQVHDRVYPFITPQFGAYQKINAGGDQVMLNPRNHPQPFRQFSLADVQQGRLKAADVQGKVVLLGLTAISIKDTVNAMAVRQPHHRQVNGVELQAHAVSQLISAMADRRPLIQSWSNPSEILWIVSCGIMGLILGRFSRSPLQTFSGIIIGLGAIIALSYGLLIIGWWIPIVPAALAFFANAGGFVVAQIYQHEQDLRLRLRDRQQLLEQTFTAVHNGPLQDLAGITRLIQDTPESPALTLSSLADRLQKVNQELRGIFESTHLAILHDQPNLYLSTDTKLNLQAPLHELLEQVYNETCARELSGLSMMQIKIVQFQPLDTSSLSLDQKQALCRFLEESLRNVGKHARSATKLWVSCGQVGNQRVICIKDNGELAEVPARSGAGTKQAKRIARKLRGQFQRLPNTPQGTISRLTW
jgi:CHASE2 domain-containing sensor protein/two-component sensor histidine kinase